MVKPVVSYKNKKLNVVPQERKVRIMDEPELHVDFTREKLLVKGNIVVQNNIDSSVLARTKLVLKNQAGEVQATKSWSELQNGQFEFSDLFNEAYNIEIQNEKLCFNKSQLSTSESSGNLSFVQTGVWVNYQSEIDFELSITSEAGESDSVTIKKGNNQLCLKFTGNSKGTSDSRYIFKNGMGNFTFNPLSQEKLAF